jgi:hypothetical protein
MGNCFERSKMRKAAISLLIPFMLGAGALAQPDHLRLGEIEFYGYAGLDLDARRAALPVHEGDDVSWTAFQHRPIGSRTSFKRTA